MVNSKVPQATKRHNPKKRSNVSMANSKVPQVAATTKGRNPKRLYSDRRAGTPFQPSPVSLGLALKPIVQYLNQQRPQRMTVDQSPGDIAWEAGKAGLRRFWEETDSDSYWLHQFTWAIAPYWPQEYGWLLNLTALGSALYGVGCIKERADKILEQSKRRY